MFDDEKIKLIRTLPEGDSITLIWVQMLCLAGRINDGGAVYLGQNLAYSDEMLATIFDHPLSTMRIALRTLEDFGLIQMGEQEQILIANWEKHQSTDKMARIRHQNRERKRRYDLRAKLRELGHDPDAKEVPADVVKLDEYVKEVESNVTVTLRNATEVRGKKLEVRSKKLDVRSKKDIVEQSSQSDKSDDLPYEEIVNHLNSSADRQFRHTTNKTKSLIKARFNEGFELEDFKQVIDVKVAEWEKDNDMNKFLRPETLFGTKFESYLNQPVQKSKRERDYSKW